jgi:hypothetical protein
VDDHEAGLAAGGLRRTRGGGLVATIAIPPAQLLALVGGKRQFGERQLQMVAGARFFAYSLEVELR